MRGAEALVPLIANRCLEGGVVGGSRYGPFWILTFLGVHVTAVLGHHPF